MNEGELKTKLVRDKIPEIIRKNGDEANIYIAEKDEYRRRLLEKLFEEVGEIESASNLDEIKEEIADVCEVIDAILKEYGFSFEEIEKVQSLKKEEKGGFEDRIILTYK